MSLRNSPSILVLAVVISLLLVPASAGFAANTAPTVDRPAPEAATHPFDALAPGLPHFAAQSSGGSLLPETEGECTPHPPIRITEDEGPQGFVLGHEPQTGEPIYRPGGGVVAGDGTEDDPYVIAGWCIRALLANSGIRIDGTEAHVVLTGITVTGTSERSEWGIRIHEAVNVSVVGNTVERMRMGILVGYADDIVIQDNVVTNRLADTVHLGVSGIYLWDSDRALVENNTASRFAYNGFAFYFSDDLTIRDNTARRNGGEDNHADGIFVAHGSNALLENNTITDNGAHGFVLLDATNALVANNTVTDNVLEGILLASNHETTVRDNSVLRNGRYGIQVYDWGVPNGNQPSVNISIERNEFAGSQTGLLARDGVPGLVVQKNNIHNHTSGMGLNATDAFDEVDARENWWGCPDGPDHGDCDDVIGDAVYDPWLTAPNEEAGAG